MSLTLLEAAKLQQDPLKRGVIETFASTSPVLERLPMMNIAGNAYTYNREETLPGVAFRAVGGSYSESTGVINPVTEALKLLGGTSDTDRALVKTQGNAANLRATHDRMKAKAISLRFTKTFFEGNSGTYATQFDGLQTRLTGNQLISAGAAASGATLTLAKIDETIDAVQGGPDVLFMNKTLRRKTNALMRAAGQAQETVSDSFGRQIPAYAGVPIGIIEDDEQGNAILDFDEECAGGGSDVGSSIYAVRFGASEFVSGLQAGGIDVEDLGLYSGGTSYRTLIEWIVGMAVFHPKSAARLYSIKNA